jgi:hypothetical protein
MIYACLSFSHQPPVDSWCLWPLQRSWLGSYSASATRRTTTTARVRPHRLDTRPRAAIRPAGYRRPWQCQCLRRPAIRQWRSHPRRLQLPALMTSTPRSSTQAFHSFLCPVLLPALLSARQLAPLCTSRRKLGHPSLVAGNSCYIYTVSFTPSH